MKKGLTDIIDSAFYKIHRLPAAALNKIAGATKYTTAKIETLAGCGTLAFYLASTTNYVLTNVSKGSLDSIDTATTIGGALMLGVLYGSQFIKNFREIKIAKARESSLERQLLGSVVKYEEKLQANRRKREAPWYLASLPLWGAMLFAYGYIGGIQITDPNIIGMAVSATISTNCLYGARYVLTTEYNHKKYAHKMLLNRELAKIGEDKNAI